MARPRTGDKYREIGRAAIAEVVEHGFASTSVAAIARRAGVAVGTLYRYFDDKEALLRAVHIDTKRAIHGRLMDAAARESGSAAIIEALWFALLDFAGEQPDAFLFTEAVAAQGVLSDEERAETERLAGELLALLARAVDDGTLAPARPEAIAILLVAPAMRLARDGARAGVPPDRALAADVFAMIWRGLRRAV